MADKTTNTEAPAEAPRSAKKVPVSNVSLPTDTAKRFELVGWTGGHTQVFGRFGKVSVSTLTPEQAERLVRMGFPKIRPKK